jgi:phosphomannomutase / phosphoglucomutase
MVQDKQYTLTNEIEPSIFRTYDIRGDANKWLTPDVVYTIARAIAAEAISFGQKTMVVARDGRLTSEVLQSALQQGLMDSGINILNIGLVPSPIMYYATYSLSTRAGVIITGSHNPKEDNGLKIILDGRTLCDEDIRKLYKRVMDQDFVTGRGQVTAVDVVPSYIDRVTNHLGPFHNFKVVLDCGNGAASEVAPALFSHLGCEVVPLYCVIDGNFPNHHPDPTQEANLQAIIAKVQECGADLGLAFDGDGDRVVAVTAQGSILWPESMLMLFAKEVLHRLPGSTIVYDVKCSDYLTTLIEQSGGVAKMSRTGHSILKAEMTEAQAPLAGELSGHIFFADQWYGFDDGMYAGARLLELMQQQKQTSTEMLDSLPKRFSTQELKVPIQEAQKEKIVAALITLFKKDQEAKLVLIDGVRAGYPKGWGLVRASNTTPCLTCRFEADTPEDLKAIQGLFADKIKQVYVDAQVPF